MTGNQISPPSSSSSAISSPLRSSPLAHHSTSTPVRALPIPRRPSQSHPSTSSLRRKSISAKSPNLSTSTNTCSPTPSPTSRSQSLLGSYPLSLIHSRMSHAHQPHSSSTEFSLHLKAVGQGKGCPSELRCPKSLDLPFVATYYDLEETGRAGPSQTPWVGTVDLEEYYYDHYTSSPASKTIGKEGMPPVHPGYRVAPVGQLQMIVKTPTNAIKAFLVPYDLRDLPVGGRLLARERTYVHTTETFSPKLGTSSGSPTYNGKKKESLRYAYQLQFICISETPSAIRRDGSTTRRTSTSPPEERGYYLSKSLRLVFTATLPESDLGQRTERTNEIVPASGISSASGLGGSRRRSSAGFQVSPKKMMMEDWSIVRQKWLAKRQLEFTSDSESALEVDQANEKESREEVDLSTLPPIKSPTRSTTPIPQPFNLPNSSAAKVQPPPSPRFARRQLRRTSAEERELSEQLRKAGLE